MPTPTEPHLREIHRIKFDSARVSSLWRAQLRWVLISAATAILLGVFLPMLRIDISIILSLGVGLIAAKPRHLWKALACISCALLLSELLLPQVLQAWASVPGHSHFTSTAMQSVTGTQIMASTAVMGLGIGWMSPSGFRAWRGIHSGLAAGAGAGFGWWFGMVIWPTSGPAHQAGWTAIIALLSSVSLWTLAMRPHQTTRIPSRRTIIRNLSKPYRPLCLKALELDRAIQQECDDEPCRDGLGEVAAWVYRLQWILQRMDRELSSSSEVGLKSRIQCAENAVEDSTDRFTQERRQATLSQLVRLSGHLDHIGVERQRALALVDFAMVNLEEARAQLVLANLQPGAHAPPSVQEVLMRLRTWSQEQAAERSSLREVASLG